MSTPLGRPSRRSAAPKKSDGLSTPHHAEQEAHAQRDPDGLKRFFDDAILELLSPLPPLFTQVIHLLICGILGGLAEPIQFLAQLAAALATLTTLITFTFADATLLVKHLLTHALVGIGRHG
jgi:hypothetical protein